MSDNLILAAAVALAFVIGALLIDAHQQCKDSGGITVRTLIWYECVQLEGRHK